MSFPYSPEYTPPAPIIQVRFGAPEESPKVGPFQALIDTGADMTLAPKAILLDVGAPSLFEAQLSSQWGELHNTVVYLIDVYIGELKLVGVHIAAEENAEEIILGRNVLNKLPLLLDGPKQFAKILDDATIQRLRKVYDAD